MNSFPDRQYWPGVTDYLVSQEIRYPHTKFPSKFGTPLKNLVPPLAGTCGLPTPNTLENMVSPYQI